MIKRKAKKHKKDPRGRKPIFSTKFDKTELKRYNLKRQIDYTTGRVLKYAIKRCRGSITEIAKLLGVDRSYAHRLIVKFQLKEMCHGKNKS